LRIFLSILLAFTFTYSVVAQPQSIEYTSVSRNMSDSLSKLYVNKFLKPNHKLSLINASAKSHYKKKCKEKSEYFEKLVEHNLLFANDSLNIVISEIVNKLAFNSPEVEADNFHFFFYRDILPNASSLDEGLILLNIGLVERCESVDELAFIIAHEISHDLQDHYYKSVELKANTISERAFKKKVRKAELSNSYRDPSIMEIGRGLYEKLRENSRKEELEADSIGLILFTKAGYHPKAAISVMEMLDNADYFYYTDTLALSTIFSFQSFPFKKEWLLDDGIIPLWKRQDVLFEIPSEFKTHPTAKNRIKVFQEMTMDSTSTIATELGFKKIVSLEILESLLMNGQYSMALYEALQIQKQHPNDIAIQSAIVQSLMGVCFALKGSSFNKVVDTPDPSFPSAYNQLLTFLHQVNSKKLKKIATAYNKKNLEPIQGAMHQDFTALIFKYSTKEKTREKDKEIKNFIKNYPNTSKSKFLTNYLTHEN
jgi:hypothetical protein